MAFTIKKLSESSIMVYFTLFDQEERKKYITKKT